MNWKIMKRVASALIWGAVALGFAGTRDVNVVQAADYRDVAYTYRGGVALVYQDGDTMGRDVPSSYISYLRKFKSEGRKIRSVAFRKNGGWAIVYGSYGYQAHNVPSAMLNELRRANSEKEKIYCVAISPNDGWVTLTEKRWRWGGNVPTRLRERMNLVDAEGGTMKHVSFNSSNGWRLIYVDKNGDVKSWSANPTEEQSKVKVSAF